jgi:hypothetical protein
MSNDELQRIIVSVRHGDGAGDPGKVTEGFYKLNAERVLTMTDAAGAPMRRTNGELWQQKLLPDQNPRSVAAALTREIRAELRGSSDFWDTPPNYPDIKKKVPV